MIIQYIGLFCIQIFVFIVFTFYQNTFFKNSHVSYMHTHTLLQVHIHSLFDSTITDYDFEFPINQAEDEGGEDCDIPGELTRLLLQEEKAIQPHE